MKRVLLWIIVAVGVLSLSSSRTPPPQMKPRFYRVAKIDNVWWFIRPDGQPFFSSGVNVVDPGPVATTTIRGGLRTPRFAIIQTPRAGRERHTNGLTQWGFNTVGGWSAPEMTKGPLPYIEVLHVGGKLGAPFNDLLHPDYAERLDSWIREHVKPRAGDTNLLGWCTDNEQSWFPDMLFWCHIRQSPESKTRQVLVQLLEDHYQHDFRTVGSGLQSDGRA